MNEDIRKAKELFNRFRYGETPEESIGAALEMRTHFDDCWAKETKDGVGEAILNILCPKKGKPPEKLIGIDGRPIHDLTGDRPDTPEWITFLLIVDVDNPYYYEYDDALRNYDYDVDWVLGIEVEIQKIKTIKAVAPNIEKAFAKAQKKLPTGAKILERRELTLPAHEVQIIEAFNEESAKDKVKNDLAKNENIKSIKLKTLGKKGFLWTKKKPNLYEFCIFKHASVEITYK